MADLLSFGDPAPPRLSFGLPGDSKKGGRGSAWHAGEGELPGDWTPKPTAPPPATTPPTPAPTADQSNALAQVTQYLNEYGLGGLAGWAWNEIVAGKDSDQVLLDLYNTPQFKTRFPAIFTRQAAGLPAISPGDYVSYENQATQIMRAAGLPPGFWDKPEDFTNLIAADVSTSELQSRVQLASQAAYQVPDSVKTVLQRDYGINSGDLAANFLDPTQALPVLQQKFLGAQIGGAADQTGYGSNKAMDDYLASLGVTQAGAQQGFTDLASKQSLFTGLPGENAPDISQAAQVGAEFAGNAADQQQIALRSQQRIAQFNKGGQFASGSGGFSGAGTAGTQ